MFGRILACIGCVVLPTASWALGPHEVLVLVNANSPASGRVAREFASLHQVPEVNLVSLNVARGKAKVPLAMSPQQFTEEIWQPALRAVRERGIGDHILAWAYSVDFPVRVDTDPPVSILGLTFARNRLPDAKSVGEGTYLSALFAGPSGLGGVEFGAQSLDAQKEWLGDDTPLPSMALGYIGDRGNTLDEVIGALRRGAASGTTPPSGTVYFVSTPDIRSKCRQWQFDGARGQLTMAGVPAVITNAFPSGRQDIIGIMLGAETVDPAQGRCRYLPGAVADNLTSFGAAFDAPDQTKVSAWIAAGASAAAGAVTEPLAAWPKFPSARLFVYWASGCALIESYYQSIRCPFQLLIVGDPLASPWGVRDSLAIEGLSRGAIRGPVTVSARIASGRFYPRCVWLLDGRVIQRGSGEEPLELDAGRLEPGRHALRIVAYTSGTLRHQSFAEQAFTVESRTSSGR